MSSAFRDRDDRIMRCFIFPFYTPLTEHLRNHPASLKTMVKQTSIRKLLRFLFWYLVRRPCSRISGTRIGTHDLRYKAHILHRDISDTNITVTKKNNADWFILNDFDSATRVDEDG